MGGEGGRGGKCSRDGEDWARSTAIGEELEPQLAEGEEVADEVAAAAAAAAAAADEAAPKGGVVGCGNGDVDGKTEPKG